MKSLTVTQKILLALVLFGFLSALSTLPQRLKAEASFDQVEILADARSLDEWRSILRLDHQEFGNLLRTYGVRSIALAERRLEDLTDSGKASLFSPAEWDLTLRSGLVVDSSSPEFASLALFNLARWSDGSPGTYLLLYDSDVASDIGRLLALNEGLEVESFLDGRLLWVPLSQRALNNLSYGFDRSLASRWSDLGFSLWLRAENREGLSESKVAELFEEWSSHGEVQGVIFAGLLNEAVGYPDQLEKSAEELAARGWKVGYIELPPRAQQAGIETLVRELPGQTVRVFAVSPAHQAKLSPFRLLGMHSLAARERNISVLYVRPYAVPGRPELDEEFFGGLAESLPGLGTASTFPQDLSPPIFLVTFLTSLAVGALSLLVLSEIGFSKPRPWWVLILLAPALGLVLAEVLGRGLLYRSLLALAVSLAAPGYLGLRYIFPVIDRPLPPDGKTLVRGLALLAGLSLGSLLTGLWVAGLLSETTFLLGLDRFRGVKLLTLGGPVLLVGLLILKKYRWADYLAGLGRSVKVYQALAAGGLALALFVLYLRTGNEAGAAATESERVLRVVLDQMLGVRPRFKEFLLAHPALVCLPLIATKAGFLGSLLFVLLAGIGQAGIVDTFAHLHTALQVTLVRVLLGVALGAVFGCALWGVFRVVWRAWTAPVSKSAGEAPNSD